MNDDDGTVIVLALYDIVLAMIWFWPREEDFSSFVIIVYFGHWIIISRRIGIMHGWW
jgi:hypothetical protein